MKNLPSFKVALLLCVLFWMQGNAFAAKNVLLKESMKNGLVSVKAISAGGYMGKCLKVNLRNNSAIDMNVKVDPALIFVPDKPEFQHLVAVGEEQILLKPNEEKSVVLQTFCGKAKAHSPAGNVGYKYWKQGDSAMIMASQYIKQHSLFNFMGQHAIWVFTDHHCLSNVYDPVGKSDVGRDFVKYLAVLTGSEIPEYFTFHNVSQDHSSTEVYDTRVSRVYVDIHWNKESRRNLRLTVYNSKGEVYRRIEDGQVSNSNGEHSVKIAFDPAVDPKGLYFVQLKDDENNVWVQKKVVLQSGGCN